MTQDVHAGCEQNVLYSDHKMFFIVTIAQLWIRLPREAAVSELGAFQDLARQSHGQASLVFVPSTTTSEITHNLRR